MNRVKRRKSTTINIGNAQKVLIKADNEADKIMGSSRQLDEFEYTSDVLSPPYEPRELIALVDRNDSLKQHITAIATNIADFGYGIKYKDNFDSSKKTKFKAEADKEWDILKRLYQHINPLQDFNFIIHDMVIDMLTIGYGMIEVMRNGTGKVCSIEYARACNFRLVKNTYSNVKLNVWEETENSYEQVENTVKFKKFVQMVNGKKVYFKEFGDPRNMNFETGEYSENTPTDKLATEIAYFHIHSSYTDYGVPSWINVSIPASGNILSEVLNYKYFSDGKILPIAIVVNGGQLTEESAEAIRNSRGIENAYKALILEASPFEESQEDKYLNKSADPKVSIDIKSLTDTNNKDALFQSYQKDGKEKIRDSFRLPPIYTGASADYNRATADTAKSIAEEQIFIPERKRICDVFNKIINNELGIKYCEVYLKGPKISDTEQMATIINALNAAGAITPNMLNDFTSETFGKDFEVWSEELGNIPFELLKLKMSMSAETENEQPLEKADKSIDEDINRLINIIEREMSDVND